MSDLSWLNPTPHAIAVYASQPLSPVTTQHSLPSGCYSLLGLDLHRLDRTSLRLAHLFDHLVSAGEQRRWDFDAHCPRGLQIDHQLVLGCRLHRELGRLLTLPNSNAAKPVMLPAGRAKLSTKPLPTGSVTCANTTGILSVACRNAATLGVPDARMMSDSRATNSAAPLRMRSASSPPHR